MGIRKVSQKIAAAWKNGEASSCGNTWTDGHVVRLHDNAILSRSPAGVVEINLCGWNTKTTRTRINEILQVVGIRNYAKVVVMSLSGKPALFRRSTRNLNVVHEEYIPVEGWVKVGVVRKGPSR